MCPPGPVSEIRIRSDAPVIASGRIPSVPGGRLGSTWNARIDRTPLEHAIAHHLDRATRDDLLCRLEEKPSASGQLFRTVKDDGDPCRNRGVRVVTAGVHHAGYLGRVRGGRHFLNGQSVEIGPKGDDRPRVAYVHDQPSRPRPALRLQSSLLEKGKDCLGGTKLVVTQLGMAVDAASQGNRLVGDCGDQL